MKLNKFFLTTLIFIILNNSATANQITSASDLDIEREQVIRQYVLDLQKADNKAIIELFVEDGTVVSTSQGQVNAKTFFNSFLTEIASATTTFKQQFSNDKDSNRYAARFHFTFKLKDGETGDGEYVDEFIFANHSAKLASVYMFENLKFNISVIASAAQQSSR